MRVRSGRKIGLSCCDCKLDAPFRLHYHRGNLCRGSRVHRNHSMPGTHIALLGLTFFCAGALAQTDATPSPAPPSSPPPALTAPEPAPAATPAPGTEPEVAPTPAPADDAGHG